MNTQDNYSVIGRWTEPDGKQDWDIIHPGPLPYDEALKISREANITWTKNATAEYKNLPHTEMVIKYETLQNMLKVENT